MRGAQGVVKRLECVGTACDRPRRETPTSGLLFLCLNTVHNVNGEISITRCIFILNDNMVSHYEKCCFRARLLDVLL